MTRWLICLCAVSALMARDPFAVPVVTAQPVVVAPVKIDFKLNGIVSVQTKSLACFHVEKQYLIVGVGEEVADGWHVQAITLDEVELKNKSGAIAHVRVGYEMGKVTP